jgi:hypothetical protein
MNGLRVCLTRSVFLPTAGMDQQRAAYNAEQRRLLDACGVQSQEGDGSDGPVECNPANEEKIYPVGRKKLYYTCRKCGWRGSSRPRHTRSRPGCKGIPIGYHYTAGKGGIAQLGETLEAEGHIHVKLGGHAKVQKKRGEHSNSWAKTYYICPLPCCNWSGSSRSRHAHSRPGCEQIPMSFRYYPGTAVSTLLVIARRAPRFQASAAAAKSSLIAKRNGRVGTEFNMWCKLPANRGLIEAYQKENSCNAPAAKRACFAKRRQ